MGGRLPFKPCLPPNKVVQELRELAGLEKAREGGRHEVWKTADGRVVEIPRHARDLGRDLIRNILRQAGLYMSLDGFFAGVDAYFGNKVIGITTWHSAT